MVDIQCTRCGATGSGYETNYVAKFSLQHNTGCGARVGIPKYTATTSVAAKIETPLPEPKEKKPKKKRVAKKTQSKVDKTV